MTMLSALAEWVFCANVNTFVQGPINGWLIYLRFY